MADTATVEKPEAPTSILNTPIKEEPKPEEKLFTTTPTGTEAEAAAAKAAGDKAASEKAAAEAAAAKAPPEKTTTETKAPTGDKKPEIKPTATTQTDYTLVLPENSLLSAEDLATLQKESKDAGLTKEEAEDVLKSHNQVATNTAAKIRDQIKAEQDKALADAKVLWKGEVEKDPVMGGEHIAETALLSSRGYHALTTPDERKVIESIGMDFHPIFVRMMAKVGKLIGEDNRLILGQVGGAPESVDPARKLYGKTTPDATGRVSG